MSLNKLEVTTVKFKALIIIAAGAFVFSSNLSAQSCGTESPQNNWTIASNATTCTVTTGAVSLTVNAGVAVTPFASGDNGINFNTATHLDALTNLGSISGNYGINVNNLSMANIGTLANGSATNASATISGDSQAIVLYSGSTITNLNNYGAISGTYFRGLYNSGGSIGTINNYGTISQTDAIFGLGDGAIVNDAGSIGIISNNSTGNISGANNAINNQTGGVITTISNLGNIVGVNASGIKNAGSITSINNSSGASISGANGYGIENTGIITTLNNTGTINGGILNSGAGSIGTVNNAQSGLVFVNSVPGVNMPSRYNIIVNSASSFGTADFQSINGSTIFGVASSSTLMANTYLGILSGISSLGISNYSSIFNTWTNFNSSYKWELIAGANSTTWNLVVAALAPPPPVTTNITGAGTIYQSSNLGTTVNPVFDGGTLQVSSTGNIANNFTVNGNNGVIDQNSVASNFTGVISNASAGSPGSITITNSGSGGSVTFSGENTYTGSTTINNGATLALSGAGSVSQSSGVTNNGTFNIAGKTGNVSVASYTQGATGTLSMGIVPSNSPKLNVNGVASLAGGLSLTASSGSYAPGKYTLLTANGGVTGSFGNLTTNLSSYTRLGYGLAYDANDVYLIFTPNVADTQQSLVNTASALQNIYTLQNSVLANSFSYDCNEFGANGVCISVGGRNTAVSAANGLNSTSGLLIAAYRPHRNYRIGAYVDQNLSVNNAGSTVNLGNNTPLIGLFGAWNERVDGTGTEVKVSAAYGQKNTTINRQVVGTSEAGSGSSQLNSQGAQVTAKYGFAALPAVIVSPYIGIRYTQNNMGGYTEGTSATVTAPLTYSALNTNATTALAGLGASYRFIPKATLFASAGVETDTNTANGTYSATGLTGLTPINFNANPVKTRPTATIGAYYDVEKNQRVGVTGIYRQEPFQAVQTTTVMATYTVGL
ncbi:S-layer family protein [Polynucleobacter sp. AP-RePozz3-80-G7]|uniref:beta strand repeat-containing protein n=1 Tax=Polynucleobacter sp. AP-RePozz3-80-G7 TaxID=2689105 RepID=UPI001C0C15AA|nr:autotransporter outer membrane beta-barrel domain-containing protein [Polynucleobacter sp. AP-RePozz3-80-G7]MBU3639548.1 autotransporter outer membrane beta-barrel domain-containing protein [Polynucleobacter sp. AP-RePozz3-80-G7]